MDLNDLLNDPLDNLLDDSLNDSLDDMIDDSAYKRSQRLENCGRYLGRYFKPIDGTYSARPFYCNIWRDNECPICFQRRVDRLRERMLDAARNEGLRVARPATQALAEVLADSLPREDYLRLPQQDGTEVFFIHGRYGVGNVIRAEWVLKSDWTKLVDTPQPRRISGQLGKEKDKDVETVVVPSVVLGSVTIPQERQALQAVLDQTAHLRPQTVEELETALQTRMDVFVSVLEAAGGSVLHRVNSRHRLTSSIEWVDYTLDGSGNTIGSGYRKKRE